ncbi:MAG: hypothetical protein U1E28_14965 [Beijerinckiaceae bacterium]
MNDKTSGGAATLPRSWKTAAAAVGLGEPRQPRLPAKQKRKSRLLPTQWPKVGGGDLELAHTEAFRSPQFRDLFRPGEIRLLYAGGCPGLGALSHRVHLPAYKASTCSEDGLARRAFELRRDEVGAYFFQNGDYVREDGWDGWFPSHLYPVRGPSSESPVSIRERALIVRMPDGCSAERFDEIFDREVRKGGLDLWAMTPEARNHCAFLGIDPALLQRFTRYPNWAVMPTHEIVGFSIYSGADRLIRIAENAVLELLGMEPTPAE